MKQVIRNIDGPKEADSIALQAKAAWYKNRNTRIPANKAVKYIGNRDMLTVDDDQNPGKSALVDRFDAQGRRDTIDEIANHPGTPTRLKNKMATREEYTEEMADELEPRRLPSDDEDTPGVKYTREEERTAMLRVPANTPDNDLRAVLDVKVAEVIDERPSR